MCQNIGYGYGKKFFANESTQSYFNRLHSKMKSEIDKMSDADISSCELQEWEDYFFDKYYVAPITIFEANIESSIEKIKINDFAHGRGGYQTNGCRITFKIPFDGNSDLFDLQPSTVTYWQYETKNFVAPYGENCGSFTLYYEYPEWELQSKREGMSDYVQNKFKHDFEFYKTMITRVNSSVDAYNKNLSSIIHRSLSERKGSADNFSAIATALNISQNIDENAPNKNPIALKRVTRKPTSKPKTSTTMPEPYISDDDYENINNIIFSCGTTMENTARTYFANNEEELRDHLLATLNTHYKSATGETFRKIGKTDINIEFENKAAFIGECKIWQGEKYFKQAIQQVINYSTWRDLKVSVIIFNKNNKSFKPILDKISSWAEANAVSHTHPEANRWNCKYHCQDKNINIKLTILVFDLYVDRTQFKDSRYEDK